MYRGDTCRSATNKRVVDSMGKVLPALYLKVTFAIHGVGHEVGEGTCHVIYSFLDGLCESTNLFLRSDLSRKLNVKAGYRRIHVVLIPVSAEIL